MPTKAELEVLNEELREQRDEAIREHDAFRAKVVEEAQRVAKEQGWCDDGLEKTLNRLDLELPSEEWQATVIVKYTVTGSTKYAEVDEAWFESSLRGEEEIGMDSDWDKVSVQHVETTVEELTNIEASA